MADSSKLHKGMDGRVHAPSHYLNGERVTLWEILSDGTVKILVLTGPNANGVAPEPVNPADVIWEPGDVTPLLDGSK